MEVEWLRSAARQFKSLTKQEPDIAVEIFDSIDSLKKNGMSLIRLMPRRYKKLRGERALYEIRVKQYRTVFAVVRIEKKIAYILHIFKKQRGRERGEIQAAKDKVRKL